MGTDLNTAMTAGVWIEIQDACGQCVAQAVYLDWRNRPLPDVGDTVCCEVEAPASSSPRKLYGKVRTRHFDVQREDDGRPSVWVRLILDELKPRRRPVRAWVRAPFSAN